LRAKLSGAVYCNRSCQWVCLCVCVCVCGSVTTLARNCVYRSSPNWVVGKGSDHLQRIKFWSSCAPGRGLRRGENFWLRLTTASAQCLRLSERFFHYHYISFLTQSHQICTFSILCLVLSTSNVIQRLTQSSLVLRSTRICINHLRVCGPFLVKQTRGYTNAHRGTQTARTSLPTPYVVKAWVVVGWSVRFVCLRVSTCLVVSDSTRTTHVERRNAMM